jgi:undecaprenyl-diphosphatase
MLNIIILAIIQALTEFIPVSSSGHLLLAERLTSLTSSLAVDVALHFGTLLALLVYFFPRLKAMLFEMQKNKDLIRNLIITSIPAVIVGLLFEDFFSGDARQLGVVIIMLALVGSIMVVSESIFSVDSHLKSVNSISKAQALVIGVGQSLSLIPGTSRSGITMLAAKSRGLSNKLAAEYSFLAGIPIIFGATLKVVLDPDTQQVIQNDLGNVIVGVLVAFGVGLAVLNFLIGYVGRRGLALFGWYRLALASILFIIWLNQ